MEAKDEVIGGEIRGGKSSFVIFPVEKKMDQTSNSKVKFEWSTPFMVVLLSPIIPKILGRDTLGKPRT